MHRAFGLHQGNLLEEDRLLLMLLEIIDMLPSKQCLRSQRGRWTNGERVGASSVKQNGQRKAQLKRTQL
jgi:hypothetical protein